MGPGYGFTVKSNFAITPGHTYQVVANLFSSSNVVICNLTNQNYIQGNNWDAVWGTRRNSVDAVGLGGVGGTLGDPVHVTVEVVDSTTSTIVDGPTTFTQLVLDPVGQQYICSLLDVGSGSSGGFNQGDRDQLTAIHNAVVRSSYTVTTTHVGLVDNGSLNTLNLTRALRVTVVTFPPNVDRAIGTPEYFFDLGFFTLNASQGWVKSQRLVFEFQLYEAPQSLDSFGWTLTPGTTINVEELAPV